MQLELHIHHKANNQVRNWCFVLLLGWQDKTFLYVLKVIATDSNKSRRTMQHLSFCFTYNVGNKLSYVQPDFLSEFPALNYKKKVNNLSNWTRWKKSTGLATGANFFSLRLKKLALSQNSVKCTDKIIKSDVICFVLGTISLSHLLTFRKEQRYCLERRSVRRKPSSPRTTQHLLAHLIHEKKATHWRT